MKRFGGAASGCDLGSLRTVGEFTELADTSWFVSVAADNEFSSIADHFSRRRAGSATICLGGGCGAEGAGASLSGRRSPISASAATHSAISLRASSVSSRNCRPASRLHSLSQVISAVASILFLELGGWIRRLTRVSSKGLTACRAKPFSLRLSTMPPLLGTTSTYASERTRWRMKRRRSGERGDCSEWNDGVDMISNTPRQAEGPPHVAAEFTSDCSAKDTICALCWAGC